LLAEDSFLRVDVSFFVAGLLLVDAVNLDIILGFEFIYLLRYCTLEDFRYLVGSVFYGSQ
jgi:hypothetical protein